MEQPHALLEAPPGSVQIAALPQHVRYVVLNRRDPASIPNDAERNERLLQLLKRAVLITDRQGNTGGPVQCLRQTRLISRRRIDPLGFLDRCPRFVVPAKLPQSVPQRELPPRRQ